MADKPTETPNTPASDKEGSSTNMALIIGLAIAVLAVIALLLFLVVNRDSGSVSSPPAGGGATDMMIPTPRPDAPSFTVMATEGANVRVAPGTDYSVVGTLATGAIGEVTGILEDGTWLRILAPQAPNGEGWISAGLVSVQNMGDVPIVPAPGASVPTATPGALVLFTVDQSPIAAGQCTTLRWKVENVSEVYLYAVGESWEDFPIAGQGSQEVCPQMTTAYELRVVLGDGNVTTQQVVVEITQGGGENPLAQSSWQVVSFDGDQVPLPSAIITLTFDDGGSISGNAGCNDYNSVYTVNGTQLTFGPISTTQQLCDEAVNAQEALYLFALPATTTYALQGSQLILYDADGVEILRYNQIG